MIEVTNLNKTIDEKLILKNINFTLEKGSIVGLLGRNGAGKTTLLKQLVGILLPDSGTISYEGFDVTTHPKIKEKVVYVPDSSAFVSQYKVKELAAFYETIYPNFDMVQFQQLLKHYKLPEGPIHRYSKGMKALLTIVLSFCTKADYIILDEPTNGLDPVVKRQILQFIITEVAEQNTTVLLSTHHLDEVEKIADAIMILDHNTIENVVSLDSAKGRLAKAQLAFAGGLPKNIADLPNVELLGQVGKMYTVLIKGDVENTLETFKKAKPLLLEEIPMSLEDMFIATLGGEDHVA